MKTMRNWIAKDMDIETSGPAMGETLIVGTRYGNAPNLEGVTSGMNDELIAMWENPEFKSAASTPNLGRLRTAAGDTLIAGGQYGATKRTVAEYAEMSGVASTPSTGSPEDDDFRI